VVVLFGGSVCQLEHAGSTHAYGDVFHFCKLENIGYLMLKYLSTGEPPFEEWAEE
jgi:hypothetical protein